MFKYFTMLLVLILSSCAPTPGEKPGRLGAYQYSPVQSMGQGTFFLQGYDTEDALTGANLHCSKMGGQFNLIQMIPHTQRERASVTFKC